MFEKRAIEGAWFALSAYIFWGLVPIYFKWLNHVDPLEILGHRVIWSVFLLLGILAVSRRLPALGIPPGLVWKLAVTAALLAANWLIFIFAVINNNIAATSLGYFINPLVSVFLGMIFLGERLRPLQWVAIVMAACGILFQLIWYGELPWISLALAFSFGFYGLLRKNLNLPSVAGLAVETIIVSPVALGWLVWLNIDDRLAFAHIGPGTDILLVMGGFVTSFPLLCFAAAVTRLSLTAAGMFQYIAPSMSLAIAVLIYDEPFGVDRVVTFSCIWLALAIFSSESIYFHRRVASRLTP